MASIKVDKLPEKGITGNIYILSNGEMYSWVHKENTKEIPVYEELELYKPYKFKSIVNGHDIANFINEEAPYTNYIYLDEPHNFAFKLEHRVDKGNTYAITYYPIQEEPSPKIEYSVSGDYLDDDIEAQLTLWEEIPTTGFDEYFVNELSGINKTLSDIAFLFELKIDHYETVTTVEEGWNKMGGSLSIEIPNNVNVIYLDTPGYDAQLIYDCAKLGCPITLKSSQIWSGSEITISMLVSSAEFDKNLKTNEEFVNLTSPNGSGIMVILGYQYAQPMKGSGIKDFLISRMGSNGVNVFALDFANYIDHTYGDGLKLVKDGGSYSFWDGLVEVKFHYWHSGPDEELGEGWLGDLIFRFGKEELVYEGFFNYPTDQLTEATVGSWDDFKTLPTDLDLSGIEDNKLYSSKVVFDYTDETKEYGVPEDTLNGMFYPNDDQIINEG